MKARDERDGPAVRLLFNGDFNWFDLDDQSFDEINETVLSHAATQGNVEAELHSDEDVGCGCAYPSYVDQTIVDYSNAIIEELRGRAARKPELVRRITALPMHALVEVGGENIGVIPAIHSLWPAGASQSRISIPWTAIFDRASAAPM